MRLVYILCQTQPAAVMLVANFLESTLVLAQVDRVEDLPYQIIAKASIPDSISAKDTLANTLRRIPGLVNFVIAPCTS